MSDKELSQSFIIELRRGSLTLAVLGCLKQPFYGYALLQHMQEQRIDIEANTLYPLLRRLEGQGLLESSWDTSESRPRKYYQINDKGRRLYTQLLAEWRQLQGTVAAICGEEQI